MILYLFFNFMLTCTLAMTSFDGIGYSPVVLHNNLIQKEVGVNNGALRESIAGTCKFREFVDFPGDDAAFQGILDSLPSTSFSAAVVGVGAVVEAVAAEAVSGGGGGGTKKIRVNTEIGAVTDGDGGGNEGTLPPLTGLKIEAMLNEDMDKGKGK